MSVARFWSAHNSTVKTNRRESSRRYWQPADLPPGSAHDHSVYRTCTSVRRFCRFFPFCRFIESVSYAPSIPRGVRLPPRAHSFLLSMNELWVHPLASVLPVACAPDGETIWVQ